MAEAGAPRRERVLAVALCLLAGLLVGVSQFSAESNHPTYLPPGLGLADPRFLAGDWWLGSAHHYHVAFFRLVEGLARLGVLEVGLAALNVLAVAAAMGACWQILRRLRATQPLAALALVIALLLASYQFCTVASAFLFSTSAQPSTIATAATVLAMAAFLDRRLGWCGAWLALAGAFHANFLVLNLAAFGLAYAIAAGLAVGRERWRDLVRTAALRDLAVLLGPSLAVAAVTMPLILSVQADPVSPEVAARADRVFFHFAVPFHYYPRDWLVRFLPFLGLQALGLIWTGRAAPDPQVRRLALALQLALGVLIWTATALTTLVFLAPVSRLFVWRLAPFALLLAAIVAVVGMIRVILRAEGDGAEAAGDARRLRLNLYALPLLAVGGAPLVGPWLSTGPVQPALPIWLGLYVAAMVRHRAAAPRPIAPAAIVGAAMAALVFAALAQPSPEPRYTLLAASPAQRAESGLYRFMRAATPTDAQVLVPPTLDMFRLRTGRAVVVDLKALPLNRSGIAEWYARLEAVSGTRDPADPLAVARGYAQMDAGRLARLRCRYGVTYAVLRQPSALAAPGWREVYRDASFRVVQATGAPACPPAQPREE